VHNRFYPYTLVLPFLFQLCLSGCSKPEQPSPCLVNGVDTCNSISDLKAFISIDEEYQVMHSFGASDCWSIKYIGKNWPEYKRNQIADLLFSKGVDSQGNPLGIGLSMWRMNIGAGSYEQGLESKISSAWRREECFQNAQGEFDWSKQEGNIWFAKAAKARGVEHLLAFTLSPPVHLTKNGFAFGSSGVELGKLNLRDDKYSSYSEFIATVLNHLYTQGLNIDFFSPINEPQWDWVAGTSGEAGQEGTSATNGEAFRLITELDKSFVNSNLSTKIAFGEVGSLNHLYGPLPWLADRTDVFSYFWDRTSSGYLGNLSTVQKVISGHSYFSQPDLASLVNNRIQLKGRISAINNEVDYWQSEYCILLNEDGTQGNGRDLGIASALYVARVIHHDLTLANATSWQWWLGVSPSDYKDGLVYVTDLNGQMGERASTTTDGMVVESKMLWSLGNFSRFVRPGMIRVKAIFEGLEDPFKSASSLMISAFKNSNDRELVIVIINETGNSEKISIQGLSNIANEYKKYTTSSSKDLQFSLESTKELIEIESKSISTLVMNY
jgi:O-glycosyl hydrolase